MVDDGSRDDTSGDRRGIRAAGARGAPGAARNRDGRQPLQSAERPRRCWRYSTPTTSGRPTSSRCSSPCWSADPDVDAVFGHAREFISPELGAEERAAVRTREIRPFRAKSTMLVRRSFVDRVGPFDTALATGEFVDWYTRAEDLGMRAVMLDEVVLRRRIHTGNHGRGPDRRSSDYVRIARRTLQRRREASQ